MSVPVLAGTSPSLFRGVVVANHALGIRVVSVEEGSQAFLADLRPEDLIVQIQDEVIRSIDEFATVSHTLKDHTVEATVVILRHGQPQQVRVHLYSYPLLRHWGIAFVPEHDFRFAQPRVGRDYWWRLGRGFEVARDSHAATNAYLNALHNQPSDYGVARRATVLLWDVAQDHLRERQLAQAITALQQGAAMLERLFDYPLDSQDLRAIKTQLERTVVLVRRYTQEKKGLDR